MPRSIAKLADDASHLLWDVTFPSFLFEALGVPIRHHLEVIVLGALNQPEWTQDFSTPGDSGLWVHACSCSKDTGANRDTRIARRCPRRKHTDMPTAFAPRWNEDDAMRGRGHGNRIPEAARGAASASAAGRYPANPKTAEERLRKKSVSAAKPNTARTCQTGRRSRNSGQRQSVSGRKSACLRRSASLRTSSPRF
jgi:hypothetical protein